ncbi:CocE/NonD family hydrolase [Blastococcus saxobsidens]|uniref:Putative peptidase S15 n=1 Tax=Blastococcus saxobsidens (strain DD2) TaxID=1146883 RepID=H6RKN8_BLASD|nr:CocE/NonD family hydrolase [Blastococcus saxobsidens]CCG03654.1 putative peptidase S15 [Blastococcus saxobsidens DD2]
MADAGLRFVREFPREVVQDEHVWIPMSDGTRLAARIWRPSDGEERPVPAVLELIPYRNRDLTAYRDSIHHTYMAGHGYACVRVDLRGSGDSEGVLTDEYLEQELQDAEEILAWLAEQPWCDGSTGMMGISWGGFNALQVAARRPPGLGAVVTVCSTDDRYADDVHYMGGCLLSDNLSWASTMFAYNSCPPDPAVVGERWREMWLDRLHDSGLWLEEWLRHQTRDDYWRHGSICEDYSDVQCAVLAVSGWADGYSNAVFRMIESLEGPRQGLIGPWSHKYPHLGQPGPAIGFLQEVVRWWDRWLKGIDNGVPEQPALRVWMQDSVPPLTAYEERPGRWVGEPSWPSPHIRQVAHPLARNRIAVDGEVLPEESLGIESPLSVGHFAGKWCSYNAPPDLPYDQREEDGGSLVFDSDVLEEQYEILGAPAVDLDVTSSHPNAMVAVRLSDVAPDGRATRVTYGLLNLTHRDGHADPRPLVPGERYRVQVQMNGVAHAFAAGHRIRLSLSTSYWPLAWPSPESPRLEVTTGSSRLLLPNRPLAESDEVSVQPFGEPKGAEPIPVTNVQPGEHRWQVTRDLIGYGSALEVVNDLGVVRFDDIDLEVTRRAEERYSSVGDDVGSVCGETTWQVAFRRGDWHVRTVTRTVLTSTATDFCLHAQLDAFEGERRVVSLNWDRTVPRQLV